MNTIPIAGRAIGPGHPCFLIAEAGVNHNGDMDLARRLIDVAREAGADAVKFQTWITEKCVTREAGLAEYQQANLGRALSQFEMLKRLELRHDQFAELQIYAARIGILFLSTPDDAESADFLADLQVPLFKIGSGEVTNIPLLRHIAGLGKPVILSTGMATLGEVDAAIRALESTGNRQIALLHCVSNYPAAPEDCNLRAMDTLAAAFDVPVGFSDHTLGVDIGLAAVARGACILEKHFTLDRNLEGPDHAASLEPKELARYIRSVRTVESALGTGRKAPAESEMSNRLNVRRSLVAGRPLPAGIRLEEKHIALKRACGGLSASMLPEVLGRILRTNVDVDRLLTLDLLE